MINATVTGTAEAAKGFEDAGNRVRQEVDAAIVHSATHLVSAVTNDMLSGQMVKVRSGKRRGQMTYQMRRTSQTIKADVHPQPNSVLWILGSGFRRQEITVTRRSSRVQRAAARARGGRSLRGNVRRIVGTYRREHFIGKRPFMETGIRFYGDQYRRWIEEAVVRGMQPLGEEWGGEGTA